MKTDKEIKKEKIQYGPYIIYRDARIVDTRTGKTIKKHLRNGKYVVGLRLADLQKKCTYFQLHRLMYLAFVDEHIGRYDYVIPIDHNYLNIELSNLKKCSASEFHKRKRTSGRKKVVNEEMKKKIYALRSANYSMRQIAKECGISNCTVHKVLSNDYTY